MDLDESSKDHLAEELDSLRKEIEELKSAILLPSPGRAAPIQTPVTTRRTLERIRAEIEAQLGFFPPFLAAAAGVPELLASLWQQMRASHLRNPIPWLTKEKIFARLSRSCPVAYAILAHSCNLRHLGMRSSEILRWLEQPAPSGEQDLEQIYALFGSVPRPLPSWPEPGSPLEEGLLACTLFLFLHPERNAHCRDELLTLLGPANYARLAAFLGYVRMHHTWLESVPEPAQEKDEIIGANLQAMLEEEPRLASFFRSYFEARLPIVLPAETIPAPAEVESLLPAILEQGPLGVATLDPDYRIIRANQVLRQLLGFAENELEALSLPAITHPQDAGSCIHLLDQVLSGARTKVRMEKRFLKRAKDPVWVELTASAVRREDGSPLYLLVFVEDISERKQAEEALRGDERILERLLHSSQDGILTFDRNLVCMAWNPAMERIFGIKEADALGRIVFDLLPFLAETGDDRHLLEALRGDAVTAGNRPFRMPAAGIEGYYDAHFSPFFDAAGKVSGAIAFVRDVTERRKAEEAQRAAEERYRELFENANDIVYTHDLEGNLISVNKAAERITGYSRAEALQMKATEIVAPEHLKIACKMIKRQVEGESPAPYQIDIICKDGRRIALEVSTQIISREGKPIGVQGIARDVTERKKTEDALQHAKQNLEAWVQELEQRTHEMGLLSEMGDMLRACLSTDEAYGVIVRVAQQIFPVQVGALYVISPSRNAVEAVAVWGDASLIERVFTPEECWALRRGRVHWVEDAGVGLLCKHLRQPFPEGYLCVPMMAQSQALGILYLAQPANVRLSEARQRLAITMAEHIAMALSNLKLHETLRSQSIRDPVTGLFNRRFMEESLELELRRAARNRRPLGLIMLEIDAFDALRGSLPDDAGESILRDLGGLLQTIIRKEDIACRFGGAKFAVVLPQGNLEVTAQRAESLREMIKDLEIRHRGNLVGRVTASAGVSGFPDQGRTGETLLRAADAALQRAREEGGNRVICAP